MSEEAINLLSVEDNDSDFELIRYSLKKAGVNFTIRRVQTESAIRKEIAEDPPDLIITDYSLPEVNGIRVLEIRAEMRPDLPLIFVTGTLGEEVAVDMLKKGATDYVLKTNNKRLVPAILRAVEESRERKRMAQVMQVKEELRQARDAAVEANRAKTAFLRTMSHEIRTPLTGLIGMVDLLLRTKLDEKQRRFVDVAKSSADALITLVNNILDLSKIEADKLEIENTDFALHDVVELSLEIVAPRASAKKVDVISHVMPDVPPHVRGDPARLRQILVNLVGNAVKFTEQGEIVVHVSREKGGDENSIRFEVRDTGVGIPADAVDRLFKPFSQVDPFSLKSAGGTGLGLTISKQLVELMGGTIGVESTLGKGSTFWFTLPLTKGLFDASSQPTFPVDPRTVKVFIVKGGDTHRHLLTEQITGWGMQVEGFSSGAAALTAIENTSEEYPFHVGLVDRDLPGEDGLDLGPRILQSARGGKPVLLLLVTMTDDVEMGMLASKGFHGRLIMPIRQSKLFDLFMDALAELRKVSGDTAGPFALRGAIPEAAREQLEILVAEDNVANQIVAQEVIGYLGYHVQIVTNGKLAVEAVKTGKYDLVLMDCQMPIMDGYEAARTIRKLEGTNARTGKPLREIPIVALTANATSDDRDSCLQSGMNGFCTKPLNPEMLGKLIGAAVRGEVLPTVVEDKPAAKENGGTRPSHSLVPFNLRTLLGNCVNNRQAADKVLSQFEEQIYRDLAHIASHIAGESAAGIAAAAHALRGTSNAVSARALALVAERIEKAAKAGEIKTAAADYEVLKHEANHCLAYIPEARQILALESSEQRNM